VSCGPRPRGEMTVGFRVAPARFDTFVGFSMKTTKMAIRLALCKDLVNYFMLSCAGVVGMSVAYDTVRVENIMEDTI
jgi:hypothetical protein